MRKIRFKERRGGAKCCWVGKIGFGWGGGCGVEAHGGGLGPIARRVVGHIAKARAAREGEEAEHSAADLLRTRFGAHLGPNVLHFSFGFAFRAQSAVLLIIKEHQREVWKTPGDRR